MIECPTHPEHCLTQLVGGGPYDGEYVCLIDKTWWRKSVDETGGLRMIEGRAEVPHLRLDQPPPPRPETMPPRPPGR